jgi:hypothetical protein
MTFPFAFACAFIASSLASGILAYALPFYPIDFIGLLIFPVLMLGVKLLLPRFQDGKAMTQMLMGSIVVRLLTALFSVAFASLLSYPEFVIFTAHFGAHFLLFTIFETIYLVNYLNP